MPFKDIEEQDSPFLDAAFGVYPFRFTRGNAGAFCPWLDGLIADTTHQLSTDMSLFPFVAHPNSPADYLRIAGPNEGILRYLSEDDAAFRSKLINKWDIIPEYGKQGVLQQAILDNLGINLPIFLQFDLSANVSPLDPPKGPGFGPQIPAYPASTSHPSQFNVVIDINSPIFGPGAVSTQSDFMSDLQLESTRQIIAHLKPVRWVCREIVIRVAEVITWNQPGLTYNSASLNWLNTSDVTQATERHSAYY